VARLIKSESNRHRPTSKAGSEYDPLTGYEYTRTAQYFSRVDPASITDTRCPAPSCLITDLLFSLLVAFLVTTVFTILFILLWFVLPILYNNHE
jgi:hypothetical protein